MYVLCVDDFFDLLPPFAVSEVGLQKLRQALKILSETEKQLKTTKNQVTWLTAALLQFGSQEPSTLLDMDDPRNFLKTGSCLRGKFLFVAILKDFC